MAKSENAGMKTFDTALFDLQQGGLITEDEALRNADSPNNVRLKIKFASEGGGEQSPEGAGSAKQGGGALGLSLETIETAEDDAEEE